MCSQARVRTVQPLEREALRRSWHPLPRRQNTRVEQGRNLSSQHGRCVPSCAADQAHLRSHAGVGASDVLHALQRDRNSKWSPTCSAPSFSRDFASIACDGSVLRMCVGQAQDCLPRSGRLRARAVGPERSLARVCREAGATVRCHAELRDVNVAVSAH